MEDSWQYQVGAPALASVVSLSLAVVYLLLEQRTRANVAFGLLWILAAFVVATSRLVAGEADPDDVRLYERFYGLFVAGGYFLSSLYIGGMAKTAQTSRAADAYIRVVLWTGVVAGTVCSTIGFFKPALFLNDFFLAVDSVDDLGRRGFVILASFGLIATIAYSAAWVVLARQQLDPGERGRAISFGIAVLMLGPCMFMAPDVALAMYTGTVTVVLIGTFRFLTVQGQRAAFLSRFLSPQVSEMVRLHGLQAVMKPQELDLTVVCIDFRGFTSYTEAIPTQAVIDLISEYHEAIGPVVAEHDGMIKDYAGDGILILVGAPIARLDHAAAGLSLARGAMSAAHRVIDRWATGPHPLGVGIGVATGRVTVGAIGDTVQMEYTAVGTAVNVAARLCSTAEDGAILIDESLARATSATPRGEVTLKGLSHPTPIYELVQGA